VLRGNVTKRGDNGGGPGKSSFFFLTVYHPRIGLSGDRPSASARSGILLISLKNPREGIILTLGYTYNRSRSLRISSKGRARRALSGRFGGGRPLARGFLLLGSNALSRLWPSGARLTTNLELARIGGI
ncbi:hypothetical protein ACRALDRAFT_2114546, partial [Sodiomyces alcalophilus JCM 7366]